MEEYLTDMEILPPRKTQEKWGFKDIRLVYSMKYYVVNKLSRLKEAECI